MRPPSRRHFLQDTAAVAAGLAAIPRSAAAADEPGTRGDADTKPGSPNEVLRVAVCGVKSRGMEHIQGWGNLKKDVRITTICDVDLNVTGKAKRAVERLYQAEPKVVQDFRHVLDDKSIDAISIATPNHWHALLTILACQAGKDVYVEKPVSHNVVEGRRMVEAARRYERIVQTGTQCRSHKGIQDAIAFLRSGELGQVYMAKGLCYKKRDSIGHKPVEAVPAGLDYDLWTGPAPKHPFSRNLVHYEWHWNWDFGNGDLGNQGIHQMDLARWGLGKNEMPKAVVASGGRFGYSDDGQTPNTLHVAFEFDDCQLQFEVRGLITNDEEHVRVGNIFYGTKGILALTSYEAWQVYFGHKLQKGPGGSGGGDHFANFVKAVRARDPKLLNADIAEGHLSSAYCHLGNIAYRLGRKLHINPSTESFVNDSEADAMLTREYRAPFVVPTKV
jgi:predicted dehydrogenase